MANSVKNPLWKPSKERIEAANITRFMRFVNERHAFSFADYFALYEWSISNIPDFWAAVWDFLDIKASRKYDKVVDDLSRFPGAGLVSRGRAQLCREPPAISRRPYRHCLQGRDATAQCG